jgi:hypothetical protein
MPTEVEDWEEVVDEVGRKVMLEFSKSIINFLKCPG